MRLILEVPNGTDVDRICELAESVFGWKVWIVLECRYVTVIKFDK